MHYWIGITETPQELASEADPPPLGHALYTT